jgi:hypothetical protein
MVASGSLLVTTVATQISPTHILFHELSKPLSCDNKPSTSRFDEFRNHGLYHTFEDGLHNTC